MHHDRSPRHISIGADLLATGMLGRPGVIDATTLRQLATVVEEGVRTSDTPPTGRTPNGSRVPMVDLLAHLQLEADADLLLLRTPENRSIAARLADLLDTDDEATLIVPGIDAPTAAAPQEIELLAPAVPHAAVRIVGFEALRFADFVGAGQ